MNRTIPALSIAALFAALVVTGCAQYPTPAPTPIVGILPLLPTTVAASATPPRPPTLPTSATPTHVPLARLPIFDTHMHYSLNSWTQFTPKEIINELQRAGVLRALVSSSPDEGTRRLYELDPDRILPGLRPYHDDIGTTNWTERAEAETYLNERIDSPIYVALGEIHVSEPNLESPIMRKAARRAVQRGLVLHIHSDAETIRGVLAVEPKARILWAHAGLIEPPEVVSALLDDFQNVWTDVSIRESSIAPGGTLAPAWRDLFLKHPDRIMIGSDTWVPERWTSYESIIEFDRVWLDQLPRDIAEQIAFRNAVKLFGAGNNPDLQ